MSKRTNGEGTIYQRKNGLWCGELTIGYNEDGKRIKKTFSSMNLEELQKKLNDERYKLNRNIIIKKSDYTVSEWANLWLENYKKNIIKPSTYDRYEYALKGHINKYIGDIKLNKIRPEHIQMLYNEMSKNGQSTSSIKKAHILLNQAFEQAIKNNLVYSNPCKATAVPKLENKKAKALTKEEQEIFIKNCPDTTYGNFFIFALNTGMRNGEISALTWNDIDFDERLIHVRKTSSSILNRDENATKKSKVILTSPKTSKGIRDIPFNNVTEKILLEQIKKGKTFVFASNNDNILAIRNIKRAFDNILKTADLDNSYTVHSLRHTFATRLIEKGANIKIVSELLGHSSINITLDIYTHVMPQEKANVISLLD